MRHELVQLAGKIDWEFIDREIAPLYSDSGQPGIATRFVIGLLARISQAVTERFYNC
jgi:IS5 family transposase